MRDSKNPTVKTVLFEDAAAVTGVGIAAVGLAAYHITGNTLWDGLASILIGCLLVYVAFALGRDVKGLGAAAGRGGQSGDPRTAARGHRRVR